MIVNYPYISWSAPSLTEREELELGRRIAEVGEKQFEREFRESIRRARLKNQPPRTGIAAWPEEIRYSILALLLVGGGISLVCAGLVRQFIGRAIPLCLAGVIIYYGSVFLAVRRFNKWVHSLVAKYAKHVAMGNQ